MHCEGVPRECKCVLSKHAYLSKPMDWSGDQTRYRGSSDLIQIMSQTTAKHTSYSSLHPLGIQSKTWIEAIHRKHNVTKKFTFTRNNPFSTNMLHKKFTYVDFLYTLCELFVYHICRKRVVTGKCELFGHMLFSVNLRAEGRLKY